jgi:hypothetical protein
MVSAWQSISPTTELSVSRGSAEGQVDTSRRMYES